MKCDRVTAGSRKIAEMEVISSFKSDVKLEKNFGRKFAKVRATSLVTLGLQSDKTALCQNKTIEDRREA